MSWCIVSGEENPFPAIGDATYRKHAGGGPSHSHRQHAQKIGKDRMCVLEICCRMERQSDRQMHSSQYFATAVMGEVMITRMWASAQRDGRPAEYRWRPLLNAAVWLTPTTRMPCSNAAKTRNPLKSPGVPQTNETISAASGPKFTIL